MNYRTICIFTPTGRTYTFKDIQMVTDSETVLVFNYTAMSDDKHKTMIVLKSNIIGWSTMVD